MTSYYDLLLYLSIGVASLLFMSGVGSFLLIALKVPSSKTTSAIKAIAARNRPSSAVLQNTYNDIAMFVSKILPMSEYREAQLAQNLKIANIAMPPKLYEARAIVKALGVAVLAIPIYVLSAFAVSAFDNAYLNAVPIIFAVLVIVVGVLMYTNAHEKITETIKQKREQIDMDLPRFVYAIAQELQRDHNVLTILERHKDNFSDYFREEIETTIADMRSSNWEAALTRFEGRVGSTHLSEVTRGLIQMARGDDTHVYWENLSIRFSEVQKQQLRAISLKIPPKVEKMAMALMMVMLLLYVAVLGTSMFDSFTVLFSY